MHSSLNLRLLPARLFACAAVASLLLGSLAAGAQAGSEPAPQGQARGAMMSNRPPMERSFHMGPRGRWWDDPQVAQKLGLSADQQKKMDDIFLQSRLTLIDKHAAVEKEETLLEPLISADQPDESRILAQIDKVAQARAELEKANARMLLGLRGVLTTAQWKTLKTLAPRRGDRFGSPDGRRHDFGPGGPDRGPDAPEGPGGAE